MLLGSRITQEEDMPQLPYLLLVANYGMNPIYTITSIPITRHHDACGGGAACGGHASSLHHHHCHHPADFQMIKHES